MKTRLLLILCLATTVITGKLSAADAPREQFKNLRLGEVQPRGWLQEQLVTEARDGFAVRLDKLTTNAKSRVDVPTFDTRNKSEMEKSWWNGETTGNWLDCLVQLAYLSGDPAAKKLADDTVNRILSFQEPDGYLGMYPASVRYQQPAGGQNGELWTQACLFRGLLAYYEFTGRADVLAAVERATKLTMSKYGKDRPYWATRVVRGGPGHNFMFVDICEWLWRLTGDQSYPDFARFLYDSYNERTDVFDTDIQLRNLSNPDSLFIKHGAHVMEHLRVPLFVGYVTGDAKYWPAVDNIFLKTDRHLSAGGACISDEDILERLGSPDIGCEYCTMLELLNSLKSGVQKTGRADLADRMEVLAFNSAQGSRLRDCKAAQYCTRDNQHEATIATGQGTRFKFSPTHEDVAVCCSPNAVKFFPSLVQGLWMKEADDSGLAAIGYAPNEVQTRISNTAVKIETVTMYPFEDEVRMTVNPEKPVRFSLRLRVPAWAGDMKIVASGAEVRSEKGWRILSKEWKAGDTVTLQFAPEVVRKTVANGSGVYWQRGPLVYSLPIAFDRKETKQYSVAGFADWDYTPSTNTFWNYAVNKDCGSFVFERTKLDAGSNPWVQPPVALKGLLLNRKSNQSEPVLLVPMGSALLRHTVFADAEAVRPVPNQKELLKGDANLARKAEVIVPSTSKGYSRAALIDGVAEGFPENKTAEWASDHGKVGTTVKLLWEMPEAVGGVWLYDRPNEFDHVLAAQVKFSDGSTVEVGALPDDGTAPFKLNFPERVITWLEVTVTKVGPKTGNTGFSEIAVFKQAPAE